MVDDKCLMDDSRYLIEGIYTLGACRDMAKADMLSMEGVREPCGDAMNTKIRRRRRPTLRPTQRLSLSPGDMIASRLRQAFMLAQWAMNRNEVLQHRHTDRRQS